MPYKVGKGQVQICIFAIVPPELVQQDLLKDWHNAVGSGPWMLTDVTNNVSSSYSNNPNYWNYDERYPQNKLPYMDEMKILMIKDNTTALAALRTGKIDMLGSLDWQQAKTMKESNPDMQQDWLSMGGQMLELRVDHKPFTDIRVRKALQLALDLKAIASSYYGGTVSGTPEGMINSAYEGWTLPYKQWFSDIQAEYTFNQTKTKELLSEAGYPDGFKTNVVAGGMDDINLLQIIKAQFLDIGVDMEINTFADQNALQNYLMAGKHDQMSSSNFTGHTRQPYTIINQRLSTYNQNYTHCNDTEYDKLFNQCMSATTMEDAMRYCTEADIYLLKQHWSVNLFSIHSYTLTQSWIKGYSGELTNTLSFFYYARMWVDQSIEK